MKRTSRKFGIITSVVGPLTRTRSKIWFGYWTTWYLFMESTEQQRPKPNGLQDERTTISEYTFAYLKTEVLIIQIWNKVFSRTWIELLSRSRKCFSLGIEGCRTRWRYAVFVRNENLGPRILLRQTYSGLSGRAINKALVKLHHEFCQIWVSLMTDGCRKVWLPTCFLSEIQPRTMSPLVWGQSKATLSIMWTFRMIVWLPVWIQNRNPSPSGTNSSLNTRKCSWVDHRFIWIDSIIIKQCMKSCTLSVIHFHVHKNKNVPLVSHSFISSDYPLLECKQVIHLE